MTCVIKTGLKVREGEDGIYLAQRPMGALVNRIMDLRFLIGSGFLDCLSDD